MRSATQALVDLLHERGARTIAIGSSRDEPSSTLATGVASAWSDHGGTVLTRIDWPEHAASWLRPARRFVAGSPDVWVVCAEVTGWLGMGRRLLADRAWDVQRTIGGPLLEHDRLLAEPGFVGLSGVRADGGRWRVDRGVIVREPAEAGNEE